MRRWLRPWAASPLAGHATPPGIEPSDTERIRLGLQSDGTYGLRVFGADGEHWPTSHAEWLAWEHYLHHLRAERDAWRQRALDAEARLAGG